MANKSLLGARKQIYDSFVRQRNRRPTVSELSELWMVQESAVRSYIGANRGIFKTEHASFSRYETEWESLPLVVDYIYKKHGIRPAMIELAMMYGVSKQRIDQIINNYRHNGVDIKLRRGTRIRWNSEIIDIVTDEIIT